MAIDKGQGYHNGDNKIAQNAVSQVVFDDNVGRQALFIRNLDAADTLWVSFGGKAVQDIPSFQLKPGEWLSMETPAPVDPREVQIIGPNAGAKFTAREA